MLALLFLLIGDRRPHVPKQIPVDLPVVLNATSEPNALREDAILVSVTRDGRLYFRRDRIMLDDISNRISKAVQEGAEKRVYMEADSRARYRDVEVVLDQIRAAGITDVVIRAHELSH